MYELILKQLIFHFYKTFVLVIGLTANLLVVAVIVVSGKSKKNKTVANTFVLNLAIADILFLISLPFFMPILHTNGWIFGAPMCKILEGI